LTILGASRDTEWFDFDSGALVKRALAAVSALFFLAASGLAQKPPAEKPAPKVTYIKAGRLFDGAGDTAREKMVIVVERKKIREHPCKSVAKGVS